MQTLGELFIDGNWCAAESREFCRVVNPFTEEVIAKAVIASEADVDRAVTAADRAWRNGVWAGTAIEERIAVVSEIKQRLLREAHDLAEVTSRSMGIPFHSYGDLCGTPTLIDMFIATAREINWEYLRMSEFGDALVVRRPVGVVAGIVPWNVPIRSEVKKVIPALLAGCPIVLKPAPETPLGAARLVEICSEAGVPDGVVNLVLGDGTTGEYLVKHPLVRKVAFTGSTATGSKIWSAVANRFTRLQLELGGKSAAIVLPDADLDSAAPWLAKGVFAFSGQACVATSRILAPKAIYSDVVDAVVAHSRDYILGDPFDTATTMGPLVSARQRDKALSYVDVGVSDGASVATGGSTSHKHRRGWFVEPTILTNVDNNSRVAQEEIFGPVGVVIPYEDEDDAIRLANASDYGLGGSVYSADPDHALAVARRVDSGYISVNSYGVPPVTVPFGGVKGSGIGREHGPEGYDAFLEYVPHPLTHEHAVELAKRIPRG
ncbi:MAG TPA: aldehyde dehydrogenase family protein [Solirubrobacteraceae bacterium]|jgi:acyl-CoA reductase-like NAD-dependent aldehyde dehydrogenase|nr:aldehyde dehydrogenase family protein [Solirubrobacteraceae bacterium]